MSIFCILCLFQLKPAASFLRVGCALLDVLKDVLGAYGYFKKVIEGLILVNVTPEKAWELGITWFLAIYTTAGMYIPAPAYAAMFRVLLEENENKGVLGKLIYKFYWIASIPLSPIIGLFW